MPAAWILGTQQMPRPRLARLREYRSFTLPPNPRIRGIAPLERATGRREYGVRPIDEQIVKDQQHLADVFFRLGEIPKQIRVQDAVVLNAPWWTPDLAGR